MSYTYLVLILHLFSIVTNCMSSAVLLEEVAVLVCGSIIPKGEKTRKEKKSSLSSVVSPIPPLFLKEPTAVAS